MKHLKVMIFGYGKMGRVYGRWFSENPYCTVTAVYNHTDGKRKLVSEELPGAHYYTDWRTALEEEECDVVGMTSATYERLEQVKAAVHAGKHIICEKPICMDLDEFYELKNMIEGRDTKFLVASELSLHPVIQKAAGYLPLAGTIFHIDMRYSMLRDEIKWKHQRMAGGGILRELGQHLIDVTNAWLGIPVRVYGINKLILPGREVEDFSETVIEYEGGATVSLQNHYFEHMENSYNMRIYGTKGQLTLRCSAYDVNDNFLCVYDKAGAEMAEIEIPALVDAVYPGHMDSFKKEIDGFVRAVLEDEEVRNSIAQDEATVQIITASYESARTKQVITLPVKKFSAENLNECYTRIKEKE